MNFLGTGFVHNSIDENHSFSDNKRNYLLSVSRIQPSKGQSTAIGIAKKCGLDLVIAGNTTSKEYFQAAIQPHLSRDLSKPGGEAERVDFIDDISKHKTDGNSITYLGEVTERERDHLMMYAKALLFPIEVEEAFGMVLVEAGITGTPAIAFNRGAIPEIIEHGKTGFYGNTIDELVGFVGRVNEIKPADCREHIEAHFNERRMVEGYLKLYREAVTAYQV
jgi:glycosyltransferase involved in cell wall biosynthesis